MTLPPLTDEQRLEYDRLICEMGDFADRLLLSQRPPDNWTPDLRRVVGLRMHADAVAAEVPTGPGPVRAIAALAIRGAPWTRLDLVWSMRILVDERGLDDGSAFAFPAIIAAYLDITQLEGLAPALRQLMEEIARSAIPTATRTELVRSLGIALDTVAGQGVPSHLLHSGDRFGPAVRTELAQVLAGPGVHAVLMHAASLRKPVPGRSWSLTAAPLLDKGGDAVRAILDRYAEYARRVHDDTDVLLRGLTCVLACDPADEATDLIARVAVAGGLAPSNQAGYPHAPRTAAAAVEVLAGRPGDIPVRALVRLGLSVRNKALATRVRAALDRLGGARGWHPSEVSELGVDTHGLDAAGRRTVELDGGYTAVVEISDDKTLVRYEKEGKPLKSAPAALRGGENLAAVRNLAKQITATLVAERTRVESLLAEDREWTYTDWTARYLDHPVTGTFGRRLIWQTSTDGQTWTTGLPEQLDANPSARVRLWHPVLVDAAQVATWRDHVTATGLRQPFKQAFREVYRLAPAEEQTATYSNRYAGHILRYRQANALMRARGWSASYLGTWGGGGNSEATKEIGGWRVSFFHDAAGDIGAPSYQVELCTTDQVRFARREGIAWQIAPLREVPVRAYSEAMRDVDLFVGVTSIATDDTWADRGEDRFYRYWASAAVAELTASAEVRRDVLARILPKLAIAPRCELRDRYLRVRGTRRTYNIHLGSGNILMEPNDAYLCIVPDRSHPTTLALPFDDDAMLAVILSKAILLAADDRITDPTITRQLHR